MANTTESIKGSIVRVLCNNFATIELSMGDIEKISRLIGGELKPEIRIIDFLQGNLSTCNSVWVVEELKELIKDLPK